MAIVIGLGAAELAILAAGAIGAMILASPAGQKATREAVREIGEALSRESEATDVAPPVPCDRPCPPCPTPPPTRTDRVPPSTPHFPCPGDHTHVYRYESNQNPKTCQCFCNLREDVICH